MWYEFECLMGNVVIGYLHKYVEGDVTDQVRAEALKEARNQMSTAGADKIGKVKKA